jgi:hypothetical protein
MDQSFNRATLARCIISKDFYSDPRLSEKVYRRNIVDEAVRLAQGSDSFYPKLYIDSRSKKPVYTVKALSEKLVLRKCAKNIRASANIQTKPRSQIIKEIKSFLRDGTKYRLYRLDIASFFESCNYFEILGLFSKYRISTQTQNLLNSFLSMFNLLYAPGIPRGIETSPIMSELLLLGMDSSISSFGEVFYYSRFVDDIFIITSSTEKERDFMKQIRSTLPNNLSLNFNKCEIISVPKRSCGNNPPDPIIATIDYLGYRISVIDSDLSKINSNKPSSLRGIEYRDVVVDMTVKKTNRIKEKIIKSFFAYSKDSDFCLLKDRVVFLSTNRDLLNKVNNRKIPTGIYYNYSEINYPSESLNSLDKLLKILINNPQGRIGQKIAGKLTKEQKNELLKINFSDGFNKRVFKRFSPNRLSLIASIW